MVANLIFKNSFPDSSEKVVATRDALLEAAKPASEIYQRLLVDTTYVQLMASMVRTCEIVLWSLTNLSLHVLDRRSWQQIPQLAGRSCWQNGYQTLQRRPWIFGSCHETASGANFCISDHRFKGALIRFINTILFSNVFTQLDTTRIYRHPGILATVGYFFLTKASAGIRHHDKIIIGPFGAQVSDAMLALAATAVSTIFAPRNPSFLRLICVLIGPGSVEEMDHRHLGWLGILSCSFWGHVQVSPHGNKWCSS
jgi:hypothetical protein